MNKECMDELDGLRFFFTSEEWFRLCVTGALNRKRLPRQAECLEEKDGALCIKDFDAGKAVRLLNGKDIQARDSTAAFFGIENPELAFMLSYSLDFFGTIPSFLEDKYPQGYIFAKRDASIEDKRRMARLCLFRDSDGLSAYLAHRHWFWKDAEVYQVADEEKVLEVIADLLFIDLEGPSALLNYERRMNNFLDTEIGK